MKQKKNIREGKQNDLDGLEKRLNKQFEGVLKQLKVMDQKNLDTERGLRGRISLSITDLERRLERTIRAEIQVANSELEERITEIFKNNLSESTNTLHKRIGDVADLITIAFTNKIKNHEKRIRKLERLPQAA